MVTIHSFNKLPLRASYRCFSQSLNLQSESFKFVVVGGGTGGLSVASYLSRKFPKQVAVVEPAEVCNLIYCFC